MENFSISIIIPTFNSERTLGRCLKSISLQDYPKDKIEIIIADAGSSDRTLKIAKKYTNKIFKNKLKTGEAGKAVGVKKAQNEIIALIDSDNILPNKKWLKKMTEPFSDKEIIGSEPLYYKYREKDGIITRYCALLGMNDPMCYFTGNYDRYCYLSQKWSGIGLNYENMGNYLKLDLNKGKIPTIGANGFLIRREILEKAAIKDYLFDIDLVYELTLKGYNKYAKVKESIIHIFSGTPRIFFRKQIRRIRDYFYFKSLNLRKFPWQNQGKSGLLKFSIYSISIVPLVFQSVRGYLKKPDIAWFFHPFACVSTFWIYSFETFKSFFKKSEMKREKWSQ